MVLDGISSYIEKKVKKYMKYCSNQVASGDCFLLRENQKLMKSLPELVNQKLMKSLTE